MARKPYWDYPSALTVRDILGHEPEPDDSFTFRYDYRPMRGLRRDGMVLGYTTADVVGGSAELMLFEWPEGSKTGEVVEHAGSVLSVKSREQAAAMIRAWYTAGRPAPRRGDAA